MSWLTRWSAQAAVVVCGCLGLALWSPAPSWAYRPFVSTDAAVADPKQVEIEVGYFTLERKDDENAFIIPRVVFNYGFLKNWEAVAEGAVRRDPEGDVNLIDPGVFVKGVLREGVLQEKDGPSIAVEVGPLLPSTEKEDRHVGFEATGIISGKLGPVLLHLNGGLGLERSSGDLVGTWGLVGELPVTKAVRVVAEINGEKPRREDQRNSALLGIIWQPWASRDLWFDAGVRRGFTGDTPDWQFTLGLTFAFSISSPPRPGRITMRSPA